MVFFLTYSVQKCQEPNLYAQFYMSETLVGELTGREKVKPETKYNFYQLKEVKIQYLLTTKKTYREPTFKFCIKY